jgi:hypothetical protein
LDYLCAALNSSALNGIFHSLFLNDDRLFPYVRKAQLEQLPIRIPKEQDDRRIGQLAARLASGAGASQVSEQEINCHFDEVYGLTELAAPV